METRKSGGTEWRGMDGPTETEGEGGRRGCLRVLVGRYNWTHLCAVLAVSLGVVFAAVLCCVALEVVAPARVAVAVAVAVQQYWYTFCTLPYT